MKKYVKSNTTLETGSYLLDRNGNIYTTQMHVPSTTYVNRGLTHLSCTDAEFLRNQDKISENDCKSIILYCFKEFLELECKQISYSILDVSKFNSYAELRYAPNIRNLVFTMLTSGNIAYLTELQSYFPAFENLNSKWYPYLCNQYVKVSVFNNTIEFRISSEDNFDWNKVIIDEFILNKSYEFNQSIRYTIVRESSKGYKAYFMNATRDDILQTDKIVLSNTMLTRKIVNEKLQYLKS